MRQLITDSSERSFPARNHGSKSHGFQNARDELAKSTASLTCRFLSKLLMEIR